MNRLVDFILDYRNREVKQFIEGEGMEALNQEVRWKPPESALFKLNVDADVPVDCNCALLASLFGMRRVLS